MKVACRDPTTLAHAVPELWCRHVLAVLQLAGDAVRIPERVMMDVAVTVLWELLESSAVGIERMGRATCDCGRCCAVGGNDGYPGRGSARADVVR